jgi:hypothetical protein
VSGRSRHDQDKVFIELPPGAWHGCASESLWAFDRGHGIYTLDNSPFYARGVSYRDSVLAVRRTDGLLWMERVTVRGGHSTYRVFPLNGTTFEEATSRLKELLDAGASIERAQGSLFALDIPPRIDIHAAYSLLQRGEDAGWWDFEEGHCGHPLGSNA